MPFHFGRAKIQAGGWGVCLVQLNVVPFMSGVQRQNLTSVVLLTLNLGCLQVRGFLLTLTASLTVLPNTLPVLESSGKDGLSHDMSSWMNEWIIFFNFLPDCFVLAFPRTGLCEEVKKIYFYTWIIGTMNWTKFYWEQTTYNILCRI